MRENQESRIVKYLYKQGYDKEIISSTCEDSILELNLHIVDKYIEESQSIGRLKVERDLDVQTMTKQDLVKEIVNHECNRIVSRGYMLGVLAGAGVSFLYPVFFPLLVGLGGGLGQIISHKISERKREIQEFMYSGLSYAKLEDMLKTERDYERISRHP